MAVLADVISKYRGQRIERLEGQLRLDKLESLKRKVSGQQSLMKSSFYSSDSATKVSFLISKAITKSGKTLSDGELVKDCLQIFCAEACPEKSGFARDISLSHQTISRRVEDMSTNIEHTLEKYLKQCEVYGLALDESTDNSDTAQLAIFVRGK